MPSGTGVTLTLGKNVQHESWSCHLKGLGLEGIGDLNGQRMAEPFRSVGTTAVDSFNQNSKTSANHT